MKRPLSITDMQEAVARLPLKTKRTSPFIVESGLHPFAPLSEEPGKSRFQICKSCADALQSGFSCRLVKGCCFGRRRSNPSVHCPKVLW